MRRASIVFSRAGGFDHERVVRSMRRAPPRLAPVSVSEGRPQPTCASPVTRWPATLSTETTENPAVYAGDAMTIGGRGP